MNKKETEEFEKWIKMMNIEMPFKEKDTIMRKLGYGNMKRILTDFLMQRVKSEEWIKTMRLNLYLKERAEAETANEHKSQISDQSIAIDKARNELQELNEIEAGMSAELQQKIKSFTGGKTKAKVNKTDEALKKKLACINNDNILGKTTPFLEKLEIMSKKMAKTGSPTDQDTNVDGRNQETKTSERLKMLQVDIVKTFLSLRAINTPGKSRSDISTSQIIGINNAAELQRNIKELQHENIIPRQLQRWWRENLNIDIGLVQTQMLKKEDYMGILYLDNVLLSKVGFWSRIHVEERQDNDKLKTEIATHPIQRLLKSRRDYEVILIEKEVLKQKLGFYQNFSVENYFKTVLERRADMAKNSGTHFGVVGNHNKERVEDQTIAMVKSWPFFKSQLKRSAALVEDLHCSSLPQAVDNFKDAVQQQQCSMHDTTFIQQMLNKSEFLAPIHHHRLIKKNGFKPVQFDLTTLIKTRQDLECQNIKEGSARLNLLDGVLEKCKSTSACFTY